MGTTSPFETAAAGVPQDGRDRDADRSTVRERDSRSLMIQTPPVARPHLRDADPSGAAPAPPDKKEPVVIGMALLCASPNP